MAAVPGRRKCVSIITVIGSGVMGSALSFPARDNGHEVRLVGTMLDRDIIDSIRQNRYHPTLDRVLPQGVKAYQLEELSEALTGCDFVIGGVSSFGVDWFAEKILPDLPAGLPVLSVTKGMLDQPDGTLTPYPHFYQSRVPGGSYNAIGGPCTSYELADRDQSQVCFCGEDMALLRRLRDAMQTDYYHISLSTDVVGVECAVAMKNAYALAVTIAAGISLRDGDVQHYNSQAALFGQSVREMRRLLRLCGAKDENIVYGAGDLYVTIYGGRTRKLGILLGKGLSFDQAIEQLSGVTLESVVISTRTARAVRALIASGQVPEGDFPLLLHIDDIINHGAKVQIPWDRFTRED